MLGVTLALAGCARGPRLELYEGPHWASYLRQGSFPGPCDVYLTYTSPWIGPMSDEEFAAFLKSKMAPDAWDEGGTLTEYDGTLIVRGPDRLHRAVADYLRTHPTGP